MTLADYRDYVKKKYKIGQVINVSIDGEKKPVKIAKYLPDFVVCERKKYTVCVSYFKICESENEKQSEILIPHRIAKGGR